VITPTQLSAVIADEIQRLLDRHSVKELLRETIRDQRTKVVKECLCALGRQRGYRVAASGCAADDPEWLYDMVWLTLSDDNRRLIRQTMVMESEWQWPSNSEAAEVDLDFQKLVQAKADVRVWIFATPNDEIRLRHIANCKKQIEEFTGTSPKDEYLFISLIWDGEKSEIEPYQASS
jgi:hypothetical protein